MYQLLDLVLKISNVQPRFNQGAKFLRKVISDESKLILEKEFNQL